MGGGGHAINGLTGRPAVVFSFKEAPTAVVSNIVSEPVFFTKLLMHEWPGKAAGETSKVLLKCSCSFILLQAAAKRSPPEL